jgi:hypothetical protein
VKEELEIVEDRGNGDGMLDPGEEGDMIITLRNYGQIGASNVAVTLLSEDERITVHSGQASYGTLDAGQSKDNSDNPFVLEADSGTATGHYAWMKIIVTADVTEYSDTVGFWLQVGPHGGDFLVFDPDPTPLSGPIIRDGLEAMGFAGMFASGLAELRSCLPGFDAVFVTLGIYPNDYVIPAGSATAESLVSYMVNHGGNLYMEGGDLWYYHPTVGGHIFAPYFSIDATGDGSGDLHTVQGQAGTFTAGMSFSYGGENNFMDHIEPLSPAVKIFNNPGDYHGCGVAYDAGTYKTVGLSFELGGLVDGTEPSTKAALLDSIMTFFGLDSDVSENSKPIAPTARITMHLSPSISAGTSTLRLSLGENLDAVVRLFDPSGRLVRTVFQGILGPERNTVDISTDSLPEGVYFVDVRLGAHRFTRKLLKIKG